MASSRRLVALAADLAAAAIAPWLVPTISGPPAIIVAVIGLGLMVAVWLGGGVGLIGLAFDVARSARRVLAGIMLPLLALWAYSYVGQQPKVAAAAALGALAQLIALVALSRPRPSTPPSSVAPLG